MIDRQDLKKMFGLKSVISCSLVQTLLLQLIIKTHQRDEEQCISGSTLVICMFDILKTVLCSGKGEDVILEINNEMGKRLSERFEIKQISKIKDIVYQLANPSVLLQLLEALACKQNTPLVNWPTIYIFITETGTVASCKALTFKTISFKVFIAKYQDKIHTTILVVFHIHLQILTCNYFINWM